MSFDKHSPYMSGWQYYSTLEEAQTAAGRLAFKYNHEEIVYKAVAKVTPKKDLKPQYDIEVI